MKRMLFFTLSSISWLMFLQNLAEGFDLQAHRRISERAVQNSRIDNVLKEQLGFLRGAEEVVNGRTARRWIEDGSLLEDSPAVRVRHHFHNPTRPWNEAGLRVLGVQVGESSVLWGQDRGQVLGGKRSWHDARTSFVRALTAETLLARQTAYAETFQSLGHLIHLIQDAASPAHTRNDAHLCCLLGLGDPDGFHIWAEQHLDAIAGSKPFDPSILTLLPNPLAPVPIARILDTERYRQTGIPEAGTNIGIAEYSNANFFSDDTIFPTNFPFPRLTSADLITLKDTKTGEFRRYLVKSRDGEVSYRLATISTLFNFLPAPIPIVGLDDKVFQDYAAKLLPRAVGYSAGLLNYFFRGTLNFTVQASTTDPTKSELTITNTSTEAMAGDFILYSENSSEARNPVPAATFSLSLAPGLSSGPLTFTPPTDVRAYILVFRGTLGVEEGAVAGKVSPQDLPFIFVIQQVAELTGEEKVFDSSEDSEIRSGRSIGRSKDPGKQRAVGTFFFPGVSTPGEFIKNVSLVFSFPVSFVPAPSVQQVRLRLNGIEVGQAWDRETGPPLVPATWEILLDLPGIIEQFIVPGLHNPVVTASRVPRFVAVELLNGETAQAPLLWWQFASSSSSTGAGHSTCFSPALECVESSATSLSVFVGVFFGDGDSFGLDRGIVRGPLFGHFPISAPHTSVGFTPTEGIAGFPVGAIEDPEFSPEVCPIGPSSFRFLRVFTEFLSVPSGERPQIWFKNGARVSVGGGNSVRKPFGTCVRPPVPPLHVVPLPELRFKRDWLPPDRELFQQLNIIPPEYEITLK